MSIVDVCIPLIGGIVLSVWPQVFCKKTDTEEERTKKIGMIKKIGYVLLGVAVIYIVAAFAKG